MSLDRDAILQVAAVDVATGAQVAATITREHLTGSGGSGGSADAADRMVARWP